MNLDNQSQNYDEVDRIIDAGLASYPIAPLPEGFSSSLMQSVRNDAHAVSDAISPFALLSPPHLAQYLSPKEFVGLGQQLFGELRSILNQIQRRDILVAALFALLWCVLAASFAWTLRLLPPQFSWASTNEQFSWLGPISIVTGFALVVELVVIYYYLEQIES